MLHMIRIHRQGSDVPSITRLSAADLVLENDGYFSFVKAVLRGVLNDGMYDDSDPSSELHVWYLKAAPVEELFRA